MARANHSFWQRNKYKINGLVLILPFYFLYQSLNPVFPDAWPEQKLGQFSIIPMPYDLEPPYIHEDVYTKDFLLMFKQGKITDIRQAYLNIGETALPLAQLQLGAEGILHGSQHGQEVHAIAPKVITTNDKLWLTIESWQGEQMVISWEIPKALL